MLMVIQKKLTKYKFQGEFTVKNVYNFLYDFTKNKLQSHLIGEDHDEEHAEYKGKYLKKLSSDLVRKEFLDKSKDKVILFHTSSCDKCDRSLQIIGEIAEEMKELEISFGKLNVAKNEIMEIKNIPSLVFFPRENLNNMSYFSGNLDKQKIKDFILK